MCFFGTRKLRGRGGEVWKKATEVGWGGGEGNVMYRVCSKLDFYKYVQYFLFIITLSPENGHDCCVRSLAWGFIHKRTGNGDELLQAQHQHAPVPLYHRFTKALSWTVGFRQLIVGWSVALTFACNVHPWCHHPAVRWGKGCTTSFYQHARCWTQRTLE